MKPWRVVAVAVIFGACLTCARASDSLRTADSLRDRRAELPLWSDSTFTRSDSLGGGQRMLDRWWIPLGVMVLTGVSAYLLFNTRSR